MASYSYWQSKTIAQLSLITDGVTNADKAYMEDQCYDQMAAVFAELGSGPSGSLVDLTVRLAASLQLDGDLIPASVVTSLSGQNVSVADLTVVGDTIFNGVTYSWTGLDGGAGDVLTTDGSGNLSWTTPSVSSPLWTQSGNHIYYPSGGIGDAGDVIIGAAATTDYRLSVRNASKQFIIQDDPGNTLLYIDSATNTMAGPRSTMNYYFTHLWALTDFDVASGKMTVDSSGNTAIAGNLEVGGNVALGSLATPSSNVGVWMAHQFGAVGTIYGLLNEIYVNGTNTSVNGTWISVTTNAAVAITDIYNLRITEGSKTAGTAITNQYGILIGDLNDASNNWAIYTGLGNIYFGDDTTVDASLSVTGQLTSTYAVGAPFVVADTTVVNNLNADLLDGNHASAFAVSSHNHDHGALTGLGGDDHSQYLLASGARTLSGVWSAGQQIDDVSALGIGTASPDRKLEVLDASNPQLRLTHTDGTVYTDFQTDGNGFVNIAPSGKHVGINTAAAGNTFQVTTLVGAGISSLYLDHQETGSWSTAIISAKYGLYVQGATTGSTDRILGLYANSGSNAVLNIYADKAAHFYGDVTVDGALESTGNFSVNTNKFTVGNSTGNTVVAGTLAVNGSTATMNRGIVDVTSTEALLVRKNGDSGDVFIVDTSNSRIGVGKSPVVPLDVLCNINTGWVEYLSNTHTTAGLGLYIQVEHVAALPILRLATTYGGGAIVFNVDADGDVTGTHGSYHTSSDQRHKNHIENIGDALSIINELRGVYYYWNEPKFGRMGRQIGIIAQELEPWVPEAVYTRIDGYKAVYKDDLVALCVNGIKEVDIKAETHGQRLARLETENASLRDEVESLKAA